MKFLATLAIALVVGFLTSSHALAFDENVQPSDGGYTISGGSNNGTAAVTGGGEKIHYIDGHGQGTVWTWQSDDRHYTREGSDEVLTFEDGEEGSYNWTVVDGTGQELDRGTATP